MDSSDIRIKINRQQYEKFSVKPIYTQTKQIFPLLNQLSQIVLNASRLLIDSMEYDTPEKRQEFYHNIKALEKEGDQMIQRIFMELGQTFITPSIEKTYMT